MDMKKQYTLVREHDKLIHLQHHSLLCAVASCFSESLVLLMALETQLIRKFTVFSAAGYLPGEFPRQKGVLLPSAPTEPP